MIEVKNLYKIYKDDVGKLIALNGVSFKLPSKGMVFIVGKSGCGKTTLLNIIGGLDNLSYGDVYVNNRRLSEFKVHELDNYRNTTIGFIFQDFCLIDKLSVINNIKMSMEFQNNKTKINYKQLLKDFGLEGLGHRKPRQLSSGQKQRVAIARAIVKNPEIILADEPTGNLDAKTSRQILDLLKQISNDRLVVIISHSMEEAYEYADRIIEMADGKVASDKMLNSESSDELIIDNNQAILPGTGILTDDDIDVLNEKSKEYKGKFRIKQSSEKFVDCNPDYRYEYTDLRKAKMSKRGRFKYANFFMFKKFLFKIFIVLLITFVASVFSIVEILGFCNPNQEIQRMAQEEEIYDFLFFQPNPNASGYLNKLNEKEMLKLARSHNVDIDFVYKINIPTNGFSKTHFSYHMPLSSSYLDNGYLNESNGVLCTTYERLEERFGKIDVIAGEIKQNGTGVIITDYFANCILKNSNKYKTPEDIVNADRITTLHVDAIIKTSVYDKFNTSLKDVTYKNELLGKYAYCYSLNPNFMEDYMKEIYLSEYCYSFTSYATISNGVDEKKINYGAGRFDNSVKRGEVKLSFTYFNQIFGTHYNTNNVSKFTPTPITLQLYDKEKQICFKQELLVTDLYSKEFTYDLYRISYDYYYEMISTEIYPYAVSLIVKNDLEDQGLYEFINDSHLSVRNSEISMMRNTVKLFSAFSKVFKYVAYLLIVALVLIVILNANTIIRQNVYEIGVMKAFGAKTKEIVSIFAIQMILMSITVCILLFFTSQIAIEFADQLLRGGIEAYIKENSAYKIDFNTFVFSYRYFFLNIGLISVATIISVIVPIIAIRNIKPLKIIKTRS